MGADLNCRVDIVVISWNSLEYLKCCLDSLNKYTDDISYRLIVIDNGSQDGTGDFLDRLQCRNILIRKNKRNLGYPKGLLQGYRLSTSDFVCLMNDDVVASPSWLSKLVKVMKKNCDIGILGPVRPGASFIHPYTNDLSKTVLEESKEKRKTPAGRLRYFTHGKEYSSFVKDYKSANKPAIIRFNSLPHMVSTCCALVRRKAVEKAGGIVDTQFVKYGGDDVDLCWRLIKSGYSLAITSESYVHHFEHASMTRNKVDRQKYLKINARRLYKKWEKDIKQHLTLKTKRGLAREQVLQESWLLQRLADAVGEQFWARI